MFPYEITHRIEENIKIIIVGGDNTQSVAKLQIVDICIILHMNILLSDSHGGQNIQIENYEAEHVAGVGGEQRLLLLQGLFWLVKCPYNEEIRANTT